MKTIKLKSGDEYILDNKIIVAEITKTGIEIRSILEDIIREEPTGIVNMLNWINKSLVATSPERRWAALEVNALTLRQLVSDVIESDILVGIKESLPDILVRLEESLLADAQNYNNDIVMGTQDAITLVKTITTMIEEELDKKLDEKWLWYATSDCSASRYCSLITTLMTISFSMLKLKIESK